MDTPTKICLHCGDSKPTSDFTRDKSRYDGLYPYCKVCKYAAASIRRENLDWKKHKQEYDRQYNIDNRDKHIAYQREKYYRDIETTRAYQRQYSRQRRLKDGDKVRDLARQTYRRHVEERRRYFNQYYRDHHDAIKVNFRRYQISQRGRSVSRAAAARRRARKMEVGGTYTPQDIDHQYKRQKGRCYWCKKKLNSTYQVDHVIPLVKGGPNDPSNLVVSCPHCNQTKSGKLPHEWSGNGGKML